MNVYARVLQVNEECSVDGIVYTALEKEMLGSFNLPTITQRGKKKKTGGDLMRCECEGPAVYDYLYKSMLVYIFVLV
jgi:hypothetical protein